jgi:hypothetical protein
VKTRAIHLGPLETPTSLANTLNALEGSQQRDEYHDSTFVVERVIDFQVITWAGTLHVVALVEVRG